MLWETCGTANILDNLKEGLQMYFQFLVEDQSTEVLIRHIMELLQKKLIEEDKDDMSLFYDIKSFKGIGHLKKEGSINAQKTGMLLNDLPGIMRGMGRALQYMDHAAIIVVMDNDKNDPTVFLEELHNMADAHMVLVDHEFCIAIKEMEAWILGDEKAIYKAYPTYKKTALRDYEQDGICDTWEVLANAVYPGGLPALKKKAAGSYAEIGKAKYEWADKIGKEMDLIENNAPSYRRFVNCLLKRAGVA